MKKESILYGIIGLLSGIVITTIAASNAVNNNMYGMMQMMGMRPQQTRMQPQQENDMHKNKNGMGMSMDDMMTGLQNKTGEEFDKAFLAEMIIHHQGAIDMANLALQHAKHDEIKNLAEAIISAQNKEIADMKSWQQQWGY